jgi:hypothetical protein
MASVHRVSTLHDEAPQASIACLNELCTQCIFACELQIRRACVDENAGMHLCRCCRETVQIYRSNASEKMSQDVADTRLDMTGTSLLSRPPCWSQCAHLHILVE